MQQKRRWSLQNALILKNGVKVNKRKIKASVQISDLRELDQYKQGSTSS